jgi:hypothetical protein
LTVAALGTKLGQKVERISVMKKLIAIVCLTGLLVGCKSSYDVTLNNGMQFTGVSKPKLNREKNVYVFRNASGRSFTIPEARVRTIEPHATAREKQFSNRSDGSQFNSSGR